MAPKKCKKTNKRNIAAVGMEQGQAKQVDSAHEEQIEGESSRATDPQCSQVEQAEMETLHASTDPQLSQTETSDKMAQSVDCGAKKKKRKEKVSANLTIDQEEALVEWLKEHPEIYDKRLVLYKDIQKKNFLWRQKAAEMGKDVDFLQIWYKSLRTRFGKLVKTKSGQAVEQELTERDSWVLSKLEFLKFHIERVQRRPLLSLQQRKDTTLVTSDQPSEDAGNDGIDAQEVSCPTPSSRLLCHTEPPKGHGKRRAEADDQLLMSIQDQSTQMMAIQQKLLEQLKPSGDQERLGFIEFVRSTILSFNHDCWRRCQKDMLQMMLRYIDENEASRKFRGPSSSSATDYPTSTAPAAASCDQIPNLRPPHTSYYQPVSLWQPLPSQWPAAIQNPTSVWGSMDTRWLQQEIPQMNIPCSSRTETAPEVKSTNTTPESSRRWSGLSSLIRDLDTDVVQADQSLDTPQQVEVNGSDSE